MIEIGIWIQNGILPYSFQQEMFSKYVLGRVLNNIFRKKRKKGKCSKLLSDEIVFPSFPY